MRVRWRTTSRLYMVIAGALALLAGIVISSYLSRLTAAAEASAPGRPAPAVVASRFIERGMSVLAASLQTTTIPRAYLPPGAVTQISQAAGRVALSDLAPGEVVTQTRLARVRAGPVASLVPEGLRAFAVPTSLPPGSVIAGDRVDVLATFGSGQPYTNTVVRGVEVLLVIGPGASEGGSALELDLAGAGVGEGLTLILLVAPTQQEDLAFARAFADLAVSIAPAEGGV